MTHVSTSAHTIRAKDPERDQLQADIDAFLAKPGNRIQVLASGEWSKPIKIDYRETNSALAAGRTNATAARRRRRQDEDE